MPSGVAGSSPASHTIFYNINLGEIMFDFLDDIVEKASDEISDFVSRPVEKSVEIATQPVRDGLEVAGGLTEGEIRTKAIARLCVDVVSGMALGEMIELLDL